MSGGTVLAADALGVWGDPRLTWYLTRAFGLVLLAVFTLVTVLGVTTAARGSGRRLPAFVSGDLHRRLSVLALILLVGHVTASVVDTYVTITWLDAVLPFGSAYRPLWLGLGTVGSDLLLLVTVTSVLRHRMRPRAWRAVHLTAYAAWPLIVLHSLGTGSDTRSVPVLALTGTCVAAVVGAVLWRLARGPAPSPRLRLASAVAMPLAVLAVAVWLWTGPLAPGWAGRAGTPAPPSPASTTAPVAELTR